MENPKKIENSDEFQAVKRKGKKRKLKENEAGHASSMDISETAVKRPHLPPASGDNISVSVFQ